MLPARVLRSLSRRSFYRHFCSQFEYEEGFFEDFEDGGSKLKDHLGEIDWLDYRNKLFEEIYAKQQAEKEAASGAIKITLPDGKQLDGIKGGTSPLDIANGISKSLAKRTVIARV